MLRNKATFVNMVSGLLLQIVTIINGFIVPRIILLYFGSTVNGLVSSINQFLSYITLVEGGVTGVIYANLYKSIVNGDIEKTSSIVITAKRFFKRVGLIFIAYAVALALVYPIVVNTKFDYIYVSSLTIILSIGLSVQFLFALSLRSILVADKRGYIVNFTQVAITILNIVLVYLSVHVYPSIHVLKLITGITFAIQPLIFGYFVNKYYSINWKASSDNNLIKERWDGFAINIAAFIHNCTDISLLTIFSSLEIVSIYSVYAVVTTGLKNLINSVTSGINPTIGQAYARKDFEDLNQKLDLYEYIVFLMVFFMFTMAGLLITPFVMIYTHGVADIDYYQPLFGVLLVLAEGLYLIKFPHLNLAYSANKFKEITIPAFIEAALNIVISMLLIRRLGLIGVAVGTVIAMIYRMAFHIYFTSKIVPGRGQWVFYRKLLLFSFSMLIASIICSILLPVKEFTVSNWIIHAALYSIIIGMLLLLLSMIFFKKELKYFADYLRHKR